MNTLSEVGSIQLEFMYLSKHTKKDIYREKSMQVYQILRNLTPSDGLFPINLDITIPRFQFDRVSIGASGDSFYEYLLKVWILSGKKENFTRDMYDSAVKNIIEKLMFVSSPNNLTYITERELGKINNKMDHLVCFAGAMFALGATGETYDLHMHIGKEITKTCNEMYSRTETGLSPDTVIFGGKNDFEIEDYANYYALRPETVESFFVLWRLTHDPIYRQMGWKIFKAIQKYCKSNYGYSGVKNVTSSTNYKHDNLQQSFFLSETLKYLYLLFSDDSLIPLDQYVFNTEAHPLGIFK